MAGAANQEKQDTVGLLFLGPVRLQASKIGQIEADGTGAQGTHAQKIATGQAIAEFDTFLTLEIQHGISPAIEVRVPFVYGIPAVSGCNLISLPLWGILAIGAERP